MNKSNKPESSFNTIGAILAARGLELALTEEGVVTQEKVKFSPKFHTPLPSAVLPVRSKEVEWIEVQTPNGAISVPIFNKTTITTHDVVTELDEREVKLQPYVGFLEAGHYDKAITSMMRELVFQSRNELGLPIVGIHAPIAVSAEIPQGYYKILKDSKGRPSRILVNEAEMSLQAVDSDGDRASAMRGEGKQHQGKIAFAKIPFTSQAPILQEYLAPVFEKWSDLTLDSLSSYTPEGAPDVTSKFHYMWDSESTLTEEQKEEIGNLTVLSVHDQFLKNHTTAPVGLTTSQWNHIECQYAKKYGYETALAMAFATQVEVEGVMVNGRFFDVEKNGLKLSRKDGLSKQEYLYDSLKGNVLQGVAKALLTSSSGIQSLTKEEMQYMLDLSPEEINNRYFYCTELTNQPDKYGTMDLAFPLTKTWVGRIQKMMSYWTMEVIKQKLKERAIRKDSYFNLKMYATWHEMTGRLEAADRLNLMAENARLRELERGWTLRDGGLISRLIDEKMLKFTELGTKHHSGLPMHKAELYNRNTENPKEFGKLVGLVDQKREGNDLPDAGLGFHYLLVPVFDQDLGVWVDGVTAMKHAFRQEIRTSIRYIETDTEAEEVEYEETRCFDRYSFLVKNPETMQIIRGFGVNKKDWDNGRMLNELQEAITAYCSKAGILVNSSYDRAEISTMNLKASANVVTINYGRYDKTPEQMWEVFQKAVVALKKYRAHGSICPGNKQTKMDIRQYVLGRDNGVAVWSDPEAHIARGGKNRSQLTRALLAVDAEIALVASTTQTGGWISNQGVAKQNKVQCFYPRVIQDELEARQYAEDNEMDFGDIETKIVESWSGKTKRIWLTPAKEQIEVGKFIDAKYSLKFMPAPLGGSVKTINNEDVDFVMPITEIIDKSSLVAMLPHLKEEEIIINEIQDGKKVQTRVKALIIDTKVFRSGSHSENTPAKVGVMKISGFDTWALRKPLMDIGVSIPEPELVNTQIIQSFIKGFRRWQANAQPVLVGTQSA